MKSLTASFLSVIAIGLLTSRLFATNPSEAGKASTHYIEGYIDVNSLGAPPERLSARSPEAYTEAQRAAYLMAARMVVEEIGNLYIESSTGMIDSTISLDTIKAELQSTQVPPGEVIRQTTFEEFEKMERPRVQMEVRFMLEQTLPAL